VKELKQDTLEIQISLHSFAAFGILIGGLTQSSTKSKSRES